MQGLTAFLTSHELAYVLEIHPTTLEALVQNGTIPHTYVQIQDTQQIRFNPYAITAWLQSNPDIKTTKNHQLDNLREQYKTIKAVEQIKNFDDKFAPKRTAKGYSLIKVKNKKLGFVYYTRYIVDGKLIPSRWCTHTNDVEIAKKWAIENRERLLTEYNTRTYDKRKPYADLYSVLKNYYTKDSPYLKIDKENGRTISEDTRKVNFNFINNQLVPYLHKENIKTFEQIDVPFIARYRKYLRDGTAEKPGIKPQTVNHHISRISMVFNHLISEGYAKSNPCKSLKSLKIKEGDEKIIGCYETDKLKGVFNRRWNDQRSYLLNLIIYTTNMRNIEIEHLRLKDVITIEDTHFINIPESKSKNGVRIVPLHDFVYKKIVTYAKKQDKDMDDCILKSKKAKRLYGQAYKKAYKTLARYAGYTEEKMTAENIKFYSGRHFWKTLMNENRLGDVEEVFMGHKVSTDVAKRYNHRDKQSQAVKLEKAREVFAILDKALFRD